MKCRNLTWNEKIFRKNDLHKGSAVLVLYLNFPANDCH